MEPEPVPLPAAAVTEIETTEGVTKEEIAFVFMALPPISTNVLVAEQVPLGERNRAWVLLSAHAFTTLVFCVVAAVANEPAATAPAINAPMTFLFLIALTIPCLPEILLYCP